MTYLQNKVFIIFVEYEMQFSFLYCNVFFKERGLVQTISVLMVDSVMVIQRRKNVCVARVFQEKTAHQVRIKS